jgi:hypothetical protein
MPQRLRTPLALALVAVATVASVAIGSPAAAAAAGEAVGAARADSSATTRRAAATKRAAAKKRAAARKRAAEKRRRARRRRSSKPPLEATPPAATQPAPSSQQPPTSGAGQQPSRLFAPTSFWNAPLPANAPRDAGSDRLVESLSAEVQKEMAGNYGPWINFDQYSVPVYTVGPDVPTVRVTVDIYAPALQRDFEAVPIPAAARAAAGSDAHLTVYQPSTDTLWEFWLARREADGWHARWGGKMTSVSTNPGYFPDPYGATATSLPLLGGLMTIKELEAGRIDHALALAVPNTAAGTFAWPAQRGDGRTTGPDGIPQGTHLRIDPDLDLARLNLSPLVLTMARAAQRYGIVVRDTAGCVVFYAEDPVGAPGRNPYDGIFGGQYPNHLLRTFPWQHLQVVAPRG